MSFFAVEYPSAKRQSLGDDAPTSEPGQAYPADIQLALMERLDKQDAVLAHLKGSIEENTFYRKVATYAGVAGAIFALIRLTDIYFAIKDRRKH